MLSVTPKIMAKHTSPQRTTRFDGAIWEHHQIGDGNLTVTSAGRDLLVERPGTRQAILDYMAEAALKRESPDGIRRYLAEGNHARVYAVGDSGLVMKERKSIVADALWPAIQRMDYLAHIIQAHCPRWIDIPAHYGVYQTDNTHGKEYMLMEKVDDGVTVGDVLGAHDMPREPHIGAAVLRIFDGASVHTQSVVAEKFEEMKDFLKDGLRVEGRNPYDYLTDIDHNRYNAIVEPLTTPVAGSEYKLTLIDQ